MSNTATAAMMLGLMTPVLAIFPEEDSRKSLYYGHSFGEQILVAWVV